MITLYGFGQNLGLADPSHFVLLVDCYLRATGLEFETVSDINDLKTAPKGKLPYMDVDGNMIADSAFILDYLKDNFGDPLDKDLNDKQKATCHAYKKMLEENLYWCMVWLRWIDNPS